jgi:hypothetical protein
VTGEPPTRFPLFPSAPSRPTPRAAIDRNDPKWQQYVEEVAAERARETPEGAARLARRQAVQAADAARGARSNRVVLGVTVKHWKVTAALLAFALFTIAGQRYHDGQPFSAWETVKDTAIPLWLLGIVLAVLTGYFTLAERPRHRERHQHDTRLGYGLLVGGVLAGLVFFILTVWGSGRG